jgi:hypothetical protein
MTIMALATVMTLGSVAVTATALGTITARRPVGTLGDRRRNAARAEERAPYAYK